MMTVRKDDLVAVISGKDKNKQGRVIDILPKKGKVMIQGLGLVKRHSKARKQGEVSAIKEKECFIDAAKVMPVCKSCNKPSRVNFVTTADNKNRVCNRCKEIF
jgi:large subunit ribosomal protein L24